MSTIIEQAMRYLEDTAIDRFLRRLETDLDRGRHVRMLPEVLARAMLANLRHTESFEKDIEGEVAI